jgi:hypothetical protein
MDAGGVRDVADDLARLGVDHHSMRRVADVEAMRRRIDGQVVPPAFAADRDLLPGVVRAVLAQERAACCHTQNRPDHQGVSHTHSFEGCESIVGSGSSDAISNAGSGLSRR